MRRYDAAMTTPVSVRYAIVVEYTGAMQGKAMLLVQLCRVGSNTLCCRGGEGSMRTLSLESIVRRNLQLLRVILSHDRDRDNAVRLCSLPFQLHYEYNTCLPYIPVLKFFSLHLHVRRSVYSHVTS